MFKKSYKTANEHSFRLMNYIANSLRTSWALIEYTADRSSYFLALNKFSDRSSDELKRLSASPMGDPILEQSAAAEETPSLVSRRVKRQADEHHSLRDRKSVV